jgi:hypothetical protein
MTPSYTGGSKKAKISLLVLCLLITSCASGPKFTDYTNRLPAPTQGEGRIWFYRESRYFGSLLQPDILLNGEKIGKAKPGSFFYIDRPAGNYVVTCETAQINECRVVLAPQSTSYVRFTIAMGVWIGNVVPQEVSPMTALKELADL